MIKQQSMEICRMLHKVEADDDTESQSIKCIDMLRCRVEAYR